MHLQVSFKKLLGFEECKAPEIWEDALALSDSYGLLQHLRIFPQQLETCWDMISSEAFDYCWDFQGFIHFIPSVAQRSLLCYLGVVKIVSNTLFWHCPKDLQFWCISQRVLAYNGHCLYISLEAVFLCFFVVINRRSN